MFETCGPAHLDVLASCETQTPSRVSVCENSCAHTSSALATSTSSTTLRMYSFYPTDGLSLSVGPGQASEVD